MVDLDTKMKIDTLVDYAYDKTIERMNAIEDAPRRNIYQTIAAENSLTGHVTAYMNYYCGCFEGICFTRFLEEFNRMPTPSENDFIKETIATRFETMKDTCLKLGEKSFKEHNK